VPKFPFKWSTEFVISDQRVRIDVQSDTFNKPEQRYISFSGSFDGSFGQCDPEIREALAGLPDTALVLEILDAWEEFHHKDIIGLTPAQLTELDRVHRNLMLLDGKRFGLVTSLADLQDALFSNADDIIDSRDIIKRIEELSGAFEAAGIDPKKLIASAEDYDSQGLAEDDPAHDYAEELAILRELESVAQGSGDWGCGETLIRETYFRDYAEQFASDIGAVDNEAKWPLNHVDWDAAAQELKQDYSEVEFDRVTYYIRD
jgi:hypothetical protein